MKYQIPLECQNQATFLHYAKPIGGWDELRKAIDRPKGKQHIFIVKTKQGEFSYLNPYEGVEEGDQFNSEKFFQVSSTDFDYLSIEKILEVRLAPMTSTELAALIYFGNDGLLLLQQIMKVAPQPYAHLMRLACCIIGPCRGFVRYQGALALFQSTHGRSPNQYETVILQQQAAADVFYFISINSGINLATLISQLTLFMLQGMPPDGLSQISLSLAQGLCVGSYEVYHRMHAEIEQSGYVTSTQAELNACFMQGFCSGYFEGLLSCLYLVFMIARVSGKVSYDNVHYSAEIFSSAIMSMMLLPEISIPDKQESALFAGFFKHVINFFEDLLEKMESMLPTTNSGDDQFWDNAIRALATINFRRHWRITQLGEGMLSSEVVSYLAVLAEFNEVEQGNDLSVEDYIKRTQYVLSHLLFKQDGSLATWFVDCCEASGYMGDYNEAQKVECLQNMVKQMVIASINTKFPENSAMSVLPQLAKCHISVNTANEWLEKINAQPYMDHLAAKIPQVTTNTKVKIAKYKLLRMRAKVEQNIKRKSRFVTRHKGVVVIINGKRYRARECMARALRLIDDGIKHNLNPIELEKELTEILADNIKPKNKIRHGEVAELYRHMSTHQETAVITAGNIKAKHKQKQ